MTKKILLIKRSHEMFGRSMKLVDLEGNIIYSLDRPKNIIVCDGCNSLITTELIKCLSFKKGYIHSTQCDNCVKKYFSKYPVEELK